MKEPKYSGDLSGWVKIPANKDKKKINLDKPLKKKLTLKEVVPKMFSKT